jgi:hypothetical protein
MSIATTDNQPAAIAQPSGNAKSASKGLQWTGRVLSALVVLFMLFDGGCKLFMPSFVVDAMSRLGFPASLGVSIGILLIVATVAYAIPRTAVLGAVLLTGYLGGAVATQMRAGSPVFETVFPVIFGIICWAGVYLRDCKLRAVFPVRR